MPRRLFADREQGGKLIAGGGRISDKGLGQLGSLWRAIRHQALAQARTAATAEHERLRAQRVDATGLAGLSASSIPRSCRSGSPA
ncbi:hypothetical protein [Nonomuraea sp. NPDC049758]|uniref:hypothetical protein n=1 Tax=Nonomuraea sp. NPDC049758 TaxID=3154360 RepID=UPI00343B53EC